MHVNGSLTKKEKKKELLVTFTTLQHQPHKEKHCKEKGAREV